MAALGALAQFLGWTVISVAALAIGAAGAAGKAFIAFRRSQLEAGREQASLDRRVRTPIAPVEEILLTEIGVDPAAQDMLPGGEIPDYLPRRIDSQVLDALEKALGGGKPWVVAVCGPSKVGKSRTLFEALLRLSEKGEQLVLIAPNDGDAVRSLIDPDPVLDLGDARPVVWLDDLETFVASGVTIDTLREWHEKTGAIFVATHGGKGSRRVGDSDAEKLGELVQDVLLHSEEIPLDATDASELRWLPAAISASDRKTVDEYGLAAAMVAAPALRRKLATRRDGAGQPESFEGAAIVYAAIDWARCGRTDPMLTEQLRRLWPSYLPSGAEETDRAFEEGLAWARRPVAGRIALLVGKENRHLPYDYIVRAVSDRTDAKPPPDEVWACALDTDDHGQALNVGVNAYLSKRLDEAVTAMGIAIHASDTAIAGIASSNLGFMRLKAGDQDGAKTAFRRAMDLDNGGGAFNLGLLLHEQGDRVSAKAAYQRAIELGEGSGASNLGLMLEEQGDSKGAEAAYRQAIELGEGSGAFNLGFLLEGRGDPEGSAAAYRQGIELGDARAAFNLALLLRESGDVEGAEAAFAAAAELGDTDAAFSCGILLEDQEDFETAERFYRQAMEMGDGRAASNLGVLLAKKGDVPGAEAAYRVAAAMGFGTGPLNLGLLLKKQGDIAGARRALEWAISFEQGSVTDEASEILEQLPE